MRRPNAYRLRRQTRPEADPSLGGRNFGKLDPLLNNQQCPRRAQADANRLHNIDVLKKPIVTITESGSTNGSTHSNKPTPNNAPPSVTSDLISGTVSSRRKKSSTPAKRGTK